MRLAAPLPERDVVATARALAPRIAARAAGADSGLATLAPDIDDLRIAGLLRVPLGTDAGGVGLCCQAGAVADGVDVLRVLGRANGRLEKPLAATRSDLIR